MESASIKRNLGPNVHFDPKELGSLELNSWRAHDDDDPRAQIALLAQLNARLYNFTPEESHDATQFLVEGANYHADKNWIKAGGAVNEYYKRVNEATGQRFDPNEATSYELSTWTLINKLEYNPNKPQLVDVLSKLYGIIYGFPEGELRGTCELKAQAIYAHELAEDPDTRSEDVIDHWNDADRLLVSFYAELKDACLY